MLKKMKNQEYHLPDSLNLTPGKTAAAVVALAVTEDP